MSGRTVIPISAHPQVGKFSEADYFRLYGQSLADLQMENFSGARSLRDAKRVLRAAIDACLDGRSLKSREVMLALRRREPAPLERP